METLRLRAILETGVEARASDWYIRENAPVMLRIDGGLTHMSDVVTPKEFMLEAVSEIISDKSLEEFDRTGDTNFAIMVNRIGRFRINLYRQRGLMAMVMRHVKATVPMLDELGLPDKILDIANSQRGIILVTGTTGSGKSTTLACMMEHMNRNFQRHIITIEDPIEYTFTNDKCIFDQREVGLDTSSFHSALVNSLRQDPDVIVVGEMRTREGFDAALQAADTGHLVLTTLHTTNASQSVQRILDFYPHGERDQIRLALATNLRAIISQRLIPRAISKGVVPGVEIMINSPLVRKLLGQDQLSKLPNAIEASTEEGMQSFDQSLLHLINEGAITEERAMDRATNPEGLKMNLQGIFLNTDNAIIEG